MAEHKPLDFISPLGDCLYLLMDEREGASKIIVTPDAYQQISETGRVIAKGPDASSHLNEGDRVIISYYSGIHLQLPQNYAESKYHRIVREHEILCRIKE